MGSKIYARVLRSNTAARVLLCKTTAKQEIGDELFLLLLYYVKHQITKPFLDK